MNRGRPVASAVPGYILSASMQNATLRLKLPPALAIVSIHSDPDGALLFSRAPNAEGLNRRWINGASSPASLLLTSAVILSCSRQRRRRRAVPCPRQRLSRRMSARNRALHASDGRVRTAHPLLRAARLQGSLAAVRWSALPLLSKLVKSVKLVKKERISHFTRQVRRAPEHGVVV